MSDLLVSIQSRDREHWLENSLTMFYNNCSDQTNFDIQVILDADQENLYKSMLSKYPKVIKTYVEHLENSWLNIYNAQFQYAKEHDYYFIWNICDDIIGLSRNWDSAILATKKSFDDDLFVLYTRTNAYARNQKDFASCYTDKNGTLFHECVPIITKKFSEFISDIFQNQTKYVWGREVMFAEIIRILCAKYNERRHIGCDINYANIAWSGTFCKMESCLSDLIKRNFDELEVVAKRMKEYIDLKKKKGKS
jgi:hypothetical protein